MLKLEGLMLLLLRTIAALCVLVHTSTIAVAANASPRIDLSATTIATATNNPKLISREGRDLKLQRVTSGQPSAPKSTPQTFKIFIQGGLHGNELLSTDFVAWLTTRTADGQSLLNRLPTTNLQIDFLANANPDGAAGNQRANAAGVNLNRNFSVLWGLSRENPGMTAFSEPETQAIRAVMEQERYDAAIDVHGYVTWVVAPSDLTAKSPSQPSLGNIYKKWIAALQKELGVMPQYRMKTALELGDGGAFEDWTFWKNKTLSFCLELKTNERFESHRTKADAAKIDLFLSYEKFLYRMLVHAVHLKQNRSDLKLADKY